MWEREASAMPQQFSPTRYPQDVGTADDRHSTGRNRRGAFPSGKWERHLLTHARRLEMASVGVDGWCPWDSSIFEDVPFSLPKRPENSAREALNRLHDKDYVVMRPEKRYAASAKRYRLTKKGRHTANELVKNDGKTPRMVADEQRAQRGRNKWYRMYVDSHRELLQTRVTPNTIDGKLESFMHALEERLGEEPDVHDPDIIRRAAARHLVQLRSAFYVGLLRHLVELEERYGDGAADRYISATRSMPTGDVIESTMSAVQAALESVRATPAALSESLLQVHRNLDTLVTTLSNPDFGELLNSQLQSTIRDAEKRVSQQARLKDPEDA